MAALGSGSRPRQTRTSRTPRGVDLLPDPSPFPLAKIQVDGTPVRQIMGQHPPGTATAQHIQNAHSRSLAAQFPRVVPSFLTAGINGSRIAHSASVTSEG